MSFTKDSSDKLQKIGGLYESYGEEVPGTNKYVKKIFVRAGEGSILYSIGRNRFIDMARDAGAVYKLSDGIVLIHLDTFDEYGEISSGEDSTCYTIGEGG